MKKVNILAAAGFIFLSMNIFGEGKQFTIVHTNDLHSHFLGFSPNIDYTPAVTGDDDTIGGWARIASVINKVKAERANPVLVLDAGDFLMGSLFHMISREESVELSLLKQMGYDAITLGNHEFDLTPDGLARILKSARGRGGLPAIVASNVTFSSESAEDDSLEAVFKDGMVKPYIILEREGVRIGIFGQLGKAAAEVAPFSDPVTFSDSIENSRKMVALLRGKENADMVICLSHSGLWDDPSQSEDEALAREVNGIDIIISGHTHTKVDQPIIVNDTMIVQAWEYGKFIGVIDFTFENGKAKLKKYDLVKIDDTIPGDPQITNRINSYTGEINRRVLGQLGLGFYQTIAKTGYDLTIAEEETNLGNLIADASRWYANKFAYDPGDPATEVVAAIDSNGLIRDNVLVGKTGKIAVCDLFRALPLGIGMESKERSMAYPLITVYVYASEIKKSMEILTSIHPLKGSDYFLQISGLRFTYNPNRVLFDRVTGIEIGSEEKGYVPLDYSSGNKKLYRITANIYNATFLKIIGSFTMNILNIIPKDRDGNPIDDLKKHRIDADPNKPGIQEVKQWVGLMEYVKGFPDGNGDGIPDIPEKYKGKLGRTVAEASWNPVSLLKRGTWVTWTAFLIISVLLTVVILAGRLIVKKVRKRRSTQ